MPPKASLLGLQMVAFLLCPHTAFSLCYCIPGVSFCVQTSSSYKDIIQSGSQPTLVASI